MSLSTFFYDSVYLDSILLFLDTLLDVHVFNLLGVEALAVVLFHAAVAVHLLDEANHGLVALRVEVDVVAGPDSREAIGTVNDRVLTNVVLDVIPEIGDEALAVVELDAERLIIDSTPRTVNYFAALALALGLALLGLSFVAIQEHRAVDLFLRECELMVRSDNLNLIGQLMGAQLISLEQIYGGNIAVDVEVPRAKNVVFEAVDGLIGAHRPVKWIEVVKEACNCQGCLEF